MFSTLLVVLPIFALIFAGWAARKIGVLGPHATAELNRFVVYLALPALLFDIMAHTHGSDLWQPGFIATFGLASGIVFVATVAIRLKRKRHLADAAIDGLNAGYANTGFMGFPLALAAFGPASLVPTTIATIITVCVIFGGAIILIEISLQTESHRGRLIWKVTRSLAANPLLLSPLLGSGLSMTGWVIPVPVETFLKLLGGTASPCALVALGLFLAQRPATRDDLVTGALLIALKLIAQPAIAWLLAAVIFRLPPLLTHTAVLISALPTGTGPFMLAEFYRREADVTSNAILISTILSIVTVSAYLAVAH
jgi:predicted permease